MSSVCAMVPRNGDELPASIAFRGDPYLYLLFERGDIVRNRLAIGGFSDGASYALSLGLANGDVFSYVIAFSPSFIVRAQGRAKRSPTGTAITPLVYIAHGVSDNVLPIASTSRVIVAS